jgi:hypothetical protein
MQNVTAFFCQLDFHIVTVDARFFDLYFEFFRTCPGLLARLLVVVNVQNRNVHLDIITVPIGIIIATPFLRIQVQQLIPGIQQELLGPLEPGHIEPLLPGHQLSYPFTIDLLNLLCFLLINVQIYRKNLAKAQQAPFSACSSLLRADTLIPKFLLLTFSI